MNIVPIRIQSLSGCFFFFVVGLGACGVARASDLTCAQPFKQRSDQKITSYLRSPLELELSLPILRTSPALTLWKATRKVSTYSEFIQTESLIDQQGRRKSLEYFRLADLSVAPGHQAIRSKETFDQLVLSYKLAGPQKRFYEPLLLNLIVDAGVLKSVDIWDGHHRLLALLVAGYKTIGDLKNFSIMFLVNGSPSENSESWSHYLPKTGVAFKVIDEWAQGENYDEKHRTENVKFSGELSNSQLGSMISLGGLRKLLYSQRKVAWIWSTSLEDIQKTLAAAETLNAWDEVLIVAGHLNLSQEKIIELESQVETHRNLNITFHSRWSNRSDVSSRIREIYSVSRAVELEN